jgi:hypothetical protein
MSDDDVPPIKGAQPPFLGVGWSFPPAFGTAGANVVMVSDDTDIQQAILLILRTRVGERVMRPFFGCSLDEVLFESMTQSMLNLLQKVVKDALVRYEPRIQLNGVAATPDDDEPGLLVLTIDYTVRTTNSRYNLVYPYYLNEATVPT